MEGRTVWVPLVQSRMGDGDQMELHATPKPIYPLPPSLPRSHLSGCT